MLQSGVSERMRGHCDCSGRAVGLLDHDSCELEACESNSHILAYVVQLYVAHWAASQLTVSCFPC